MAVVGMSSGVAWLLLFSYLRNHGDLLDPAADPRFFRLTEPAITLAGYGAAALIGWFLSPAIAARDLPHVPDSLCAPRPESGRLTRITAGAAGGGYPAAGAILV